MLTKVTRLLKLLELQLSIKISKHPTPVAKIPISYLSGSQSVLRRPQGSATSSQGVRGYISVMSNKKFTIFKLQESWFVKNNPVSSLIDHVFISFDR